MHCLLWLATCERNYSGLLDMITLAHNGERLRVGDFVRRLFGDVGTTCDMRIEHFNSTHTQAFCMWIEGDEGSARRCWFWLDELKRIA